MNNNKFVEENVNFAVVLAHNISDETKAYLSKEIIPFYSDNCYSSMRDSIYHISQLKNYSPKPEINEELDEIRNEVENNNCKYLLIEDMVV